MQKHKVFGPLTALAVLAIVGFGANSAEATGSIESLAVGACQWVEGGKPFYDWTGIYNSGASTMTVQCGVPNNEDVQSATKWYVYMDDQHSNLNGKCQLRMMDLWGNTIAQSGEKNTSSTDPHQELVWNWEDFGLGAIDGVTVVRCTIPGAQAGKRSGLNGIFVQKGF